MLYALNFDIDNSSFLITNPEYNQGLDPKLKLDSPYQKLSILQLKKMIVS